MVELMLSLVRYVLVKALANFQIRHWMFLNGIQSSSTI